MYVRVCLFVCVQTKLHIPFPQTHARCVCVLPTAGTQFSGLRCVSFVGEIGGGDASIQ